MFQIRAYNVLSTSVPHCPSPGHPNHHTVVFTGKSPNSDRIRALFYCSCFRIVSEKMDGHAWVTR